MARGPSAPAASPTGVLVPAGVGRKRQSSSRHAASSAPIRADPLGSVAGPPHTLPSHVRGRRHCQPQSRRAPAHPSQLVEALARAPRDRPGAADRPTPRLELPAYDLGAALGLERELGISHVARAGPRPPRPRRPAAARELPERRASATTRTAFAGIERALELIERHIAAGEPDRRARRLRRRRRLRDRDHGRALRALGANVGWFLPSRIEDGYGLSAATVERLASRGTGLLITVDCGITAVEEVAAARAAGIDVVVTDHHAPRADGAAARLPDRAPGGLRLPVRRAVRHRRSRTSSRRRSARRRAEDDLELVALATVADLMPLAGREPPARARGARSAGGHRQARAARADGGLARRPERARRARARLPAGAADQRRRPAAARRRRARAAAHRGSRARRGDRGRARRGQRRAPRRRAADRVGGRGAGRRARRAQRVRAARPRAGIRA